MKKINVKVVPGAKVEQIQKGLDGGLKVWVKGKPKDNEANLALANVLANYFNVPKNHLKILKGRKSRNKVIEIIE